MLVLQAVLLENAHVMSTNTRRNGICEVLYAAAWICGEFSQYVTVKPFGEVVISKLFPFPFELLF